MGDALRKLLDALASLIVIIGGAITSVTASRPEVHEGWLAIGIAAMAFGVLLIVGTETSRFVVARRETESAGKRNDSAQARKGITFDFPIFQVPIPMPQYPPHGQAEMRFRNVAVTAPSGMRAKFKFAARIFPVGDVIQL